MAVETGGVAEARHGIGDAEVALGGGDLVPRLSIALTRQPGMRPGVGLDVHKALGHETGDLLPREGTGRPTEPIEVCASVDHCGRDEDGCGYLELAQDGKGVLEIVVVAVVEVTQTYRSVTGDASKSSAASSRIGVAPDSSTASIWARNCSGVTERTLGV